LVRDDLLNKLPSSDRGSFTALLDSVSAKLTTEALLALGVAHQIDRKDVPTIATAFLKDNGLVP
jgi:hypothetical protein